MPTHRTNRRAPRHAERSLEIREAITDLGHTMTRALERLSRVDAVAASETARAAATIIEGALAVSGTLALRAGLTQLVADLKGGAR